MLCRVAPSASPRRAPRLVAAAAQPQPLSARAAQLSGAEALTLPARVAVGLLLSPFEAGREVADAAGRAAAAVASPGGASAALDLLFGEADAGLCV